MTARLRRAAQRVIDLFPVGDLTPHDQGRALSELAAAMPRTKRRPPTPSKVEREAKRRERWDSDAAVRERVMLRDRAQCRICGATEGLELDHFWGRGRDRTDSGCWALCHVCHVNKTENRPSRLWWLGWFRLHVTPISAEQVCRVDAALALDAGKHRSLSPAAEET